MSVLKRDEVLGIPSQPREREGGNGKKRKRGKSEKRRKGDRQKRETGKVYYSRLNVCVHARLCT